MQRDKGGYNAEIDNFSNEKNTTSCFKNDEGNFFTIVEFSDEQINFSTFLNILNPICIWLVVNQITEYYLKCLIWNLCQSNQG